MKLTIPGENSILLRGRLLAAPVPSHQNHQIQFFLLPLEVCRLSGAADKLDVIASQRLLETLHPLQAGQHPGPLSLGHHRPPNLRSTPLGRSIRDLTLAVNRAYGRADYLPCIAWGSVAHRCAVLDVGDPLRLEGRLQSRVYTKVLDGRTEERTAFEVSVMRLPEESEDEL